MSRRQARHAPLRHARDVVVLVARAFVGPAIVGLAPREACVARLAERALGLAAGQPVGLAGTAGAFIASRPQTVATADAPAIGRRAPRPHPGRDVPSHYERAIVPDVSVGTSAGALNAAGLTSCGRSVV